MNKSKEKVEKELIEKNIPFKLKGDNPQFKNKSEKTNFICLKCGCEKIATPHNIINNKIGCTACGIKKKRTFNDFNNYAIENGYSILSSKEDIKGKITEVNTNALCKFKHNKCGNIFVMKIYKFLESKNHCKKCFIHKKSDDEFLESLRVNNLDMFFLPDGEHYNGRHQKIVLECKNCGNKTYDYAYNFITNHRCCAFCSASKSEQIISEKFKDINKTIKFPDLVSKTFLSYDFCLNNIYLETDGEQHFESIEFFGGKDRYKIQKENDFIKDKYAIEHGLFLIRISSNEIIKNKNLDLLFNSSTTIENLKNSFKDILIIKDKKLIYYTEKYKNFKIVEYIQVNGNGNEKDIV